MSTTTRFSSRVAAAFITDRSALATPPPDYPAQVVLGHLDLEDHLSLDLLDLGDHNGVRLGQQAEKLEQLAHGD